VAEAIYGPNDIRTHIMRSWLNTEVEATATGRLVVAFYDLFGQQIAALAQWSPKVRWWLKTQVFDKALPYAQKAMILRGTRQPRRDTHVTIH
jgi:hypothetical protein